MKNPNPKQLDEDTILYWLSKPDGIYASIKDVKRELKRLRKELKSGESVLIIKARIADKEDSLAQWLYIEWRYKQTIPETVVFT